jgi:DNA-binding GntR family transcriptional regulator
MRVVSQIHDMLTSMELLPGQPLRQEALAERLGVSRAPVREALGILQSEGVLHHERNVGYTVKRLTASELDQAYLMRRALESELVRRIPEPTGEHLAELTALNERMDEAARTGDVLSLRRLNHEFHFAILGASGLDLVVHELRRIWSMSEAYRSFYLFEQSSRERVVREHAAIIEALRRHDLPELERLLDEHRAEVPAHLAATIGGAATPAQ